MAAIICNYLSDMSVSLGINAISRTPAIVDAGLHMVKTEPRYKTKFPGITSLHSSLPAVGVDGVQLSSTRHDSKG